MAIDVRVIDTKTSRIVASTSVEGEATDFALGGALAGAMGGGALAGALGGWSKTPTEKALRISIQEAVKFVVSKTPAVYYRHGPGGETVAAAKAPVAVAAGAGGGAAAVAATAPTDTTGVPSALRVIQTIRADHDQQLLVDLNEVKVRGAVLSVVVSLRAVGSKPSQWVTVNENKSSVLNYDNGETAAVIKVDGFNNGPVPPGDPKIIRATFKVPAGSEEGRHHAGRGRHIRRRGPRAIVESRRLRGFARRAPSSSRIASRPHIPMGLANWLTIVRILLVPVLVITLVYNRVLLALATFVVAGVTDMMDGHIARTRGTKTRLGAFLDPLADKLLLTASFVTLTYKFPKILPFWLTAIVLSRDLLLILVAVLIMLTGGQLNPTPTALGKASTVFQMVTVGVALFVVGGGHDFWLLRKALLVVAAVLTIGSGIQYLMLAPRYVDWGGR